MTAADAAGAAPKVAAATSPLRQFLRRFRRQKSAIAAGALILAIVACAILAPLLAPYDPNAPDYNSLLQPPSMLHLAGTDMFGRDILSRIIWGGRISLTVGFASVLIGGGIGVLLGLYAGYNGGVADFAIMRGCDTLFAFPGILLAIGVVAIIGPGVLNVIWAVAVFSVPVFARVVRGNVLALKHAQYVEAAIGIGVRPLTIVVRHILPGTLPAIIVLMSLRIGGSIGVGAALSFIGLGAQPPTAEWGTMLADGRAFLGVADHVTIFPGLAIFVTVLCFNVLGDGLRDALDQKPM